MMPSLLSVQAYLIILTAACAVARTYSFVPTSTSVSSTASSANSFISPRPYKGACTLKQTSSPSSSRSRPYSSNKGYKKQKQTRNRGSNQANHNRRGHEFRLNKQDSGGGRGSGGGRQRVRKTNTKRPPRWEREGDNLYQEVSKQHEHLQLLAKKRVSTVQDVCDVLAPWMTSMNSDEIDGVTDNVAQKNEQQQVEQKEEKKTPPFLWGSLPVGPVLASRLRSSDRSSPTPVQSAAFTMLTAAHSKNNKNVSTKRTNAIIASPTGTGKTLAYLLPLLSTSPGGQKGEGTGGVLIVTPTIELACQIQREVDTLWPPSEDVKSSLFVVGANDVNTSKEDDKEEDVWSQGRTILRSMSGNNSPLIAGTPKMLRMLYREAENIVKRPDDAYPFTKEERVTSIALLSNLRAIVLDEADRLLRTEAVARETAERKQRKIDQQKQDEAEKLALRNNIRPRPPPKKKRLIIARQTQTELLLRDLPVPSLDDVQIICASATIGRTMRRQLMQILGAPSADAAAALVTGDEDARVKSKDAEKRKSVLLPEMLQHAFKVIDITDIGAEDKDGNTDDNGLSVAERNEEKRTAATIHGMWDTMVKMDVAKPTIIFPGRVGVERVEEELKALGLNDIRTLRNLSGDSRKVNNGDAEDNATETSKWKNTPVYIIGERFARGLDLPEVGNVILLAPPSSAAGYAHMAGRTGRSGREGTAITLVRPRNTEVQRLAAIAETLGLKFKQELSGIAGAKKM